MKREIEKLFLIVLLCIGNVIFAFSDDNTLDASQRKVTGRVTDVTGELLVGVNVLEQGTTNGTITDNNGTYILTVTTPNPTLVFTYVGFKTVEVRVGNQGIVDVTLEEDIEALDEVVVVGFGTQKKVSVVGSISNLSTQIAQQTSTPSLSTAIAGKLPGLISRQSDGEPGYDQTQIYIRGLATFGTNRQPLILVDGIERDMNSVNAQEVESITILKDASATAVYGVRGANGIILITTKSGKLGKPQIILRTETAVLSGLRFADYISGGDYASLINESRLNGDLPIRYTEAEINKFYDGSDPYLYPNVDWTAATLKKHTVQTINNLSVTGGNEVARYYVNLGYTMQDGLWKTDPQYKYNTNTRFNRFNLRSKVDVNLNQDLTMDLGLGVIFNQYNHPGYSSDRLFSALRFISPIQFPIYNPDGTLAGTLVNDISNPWAMVSNSGYQVNYINQTQATLGVRWDLSRYITKGLSLKGRFAYDHYFLGNNTRLKSFEIKQYLGKDETTGEDLYKVYYEQQPLQYWHSATSGRAFYLETGLDYDRTFNNKHYVSGMFLFNMRDGVDVLVGDPVSNLPYRRLGFAGRATYDYDHRYLLEFNVGYNGSENFPKGKRFGLFPSISGGWIVSNEDFWKIDFISNLKLRGSYGQVGNDQIGRRFLFLTNMETQAGNSYHYGLSQQYMQGIEEKSIGNPDVTWEIATKMNLGFDLGLFNNSLMWQVDVFKENRKNILLQRQTIPMLSGFLISSLPYGNLGKVENKGIESLIEFRKTTANKITYSLRGNFTYARNIIVENDEPAQLYPYQSLKGQPIDINLGYVALGFFENQEDIDKSPRQALTSTVKPGDVKYLDVNGDGVINSYDRVPMGYPRIPEISYGFGGTIGYKGFDVSLYFTGAARTSYFFHGPTIWPFMAGEATYNLMREFYDNRWIPGADNTNAKYPAVRSSSIANNYVISSLYMRDGSYLRLKTAEIGYNIPKDVLNKVGLNDIRVFVNGINLYTWDKLKIVDPEMDSGSGGYPFQRTLNVGFQITF